MNRMKNKHYWGNFTSLLILFLLTSNNVHALRGGEVIKGSVGVVEVSVVNIGLCTGSMIAPNVVITAGHCLNELGGLSGNDQFVIKYFDPETGKREVFNGNADWAIDPSFNSPLIFAIDDNHDIAYIKIDGEFKDTDYHDYLRIYSDYGNHLENKYLEAYGAGKYNYSGDRDGKLRNTWFEVDWVWENSITIDTRKYDGLCQGDSGGPLVYSIKSAISGVSVPAITGVLSMVLPADFEFSSHCVNNDAGTDDAFYTRTNWTHMKWVQEHTGINCKLFENANKNYRRCFDLPFIEDVVYEGSDQSKSVSIIASSIF